MEEFVVTSGNGNTGDGEEAKVYFVLGGDACVEGGGIQEDASRGDCQEDNGSKAEDNSLMGGTIMLEKLLRTPLQSHGGGGGNSNANADPPGDGSQEKSISGGKKSVCGLDYSTPQKPSVGFCNHPTVKRRLFFNNCGDDTDGAGGSSSDTWISSAVASSSKVSKDGQMEVTKDEELNDKEEDAKVKRKKKKRKRKDRTGVVLGNGTKTREVNAATSSLTAHNLQQGGEGPTGQVDNGVAGGEIEKECKQGGGTGAGVPPRRIAQLVVWTKNLPGAPNSCAAEVSTGRGGNCGGRRKGKDESLKSVASNNSSVVDPQPPPDNQSSSDATSSEGTNFCKKITSSVPTESGENSSVEARGTTEGDLFFVQYPARPFSDQGKGKGKPFRRLNSYNDPIVIKKTPPPPPPSSRRRGEGKRKRGGNSNSSNQPNKKEPALSGGPRVSLFGGILAHQTIQTPQQVGAPLVVDVQGHQAFHAYLQQVQQQQQGINQFLHHQEYYLNQGLASVTTDLPGGGQIITLPYYPTLAPTQGVVPSPVQYIPTPAVTSSAPQGIHQSAPSLLPSAPEGEVGLKVGGESAGPAEPATNLPEKLPVSNNTSTTESGNEFDLLIHNVVHEELVSDIGEEDMARYEERLRKRMRLSCEEEDHEVVDKTAGKENGSSSGEQNSREANEGGGSGPDEPGKPRCTYTELIEKALTESGGLTVSEIYNWISERYPYYRQDDDRWKNSVRHNLSINPYFKKGEKARSGAGHLWTISEESKGLRPSMVSSLDERRKSPCDPGDLLLSMDNDTDRAVANILGMYRSKVAAAEKGIKEGDQDERQEVDLPATERCPSEKPQQALVSPPPQQPSSNVSDSSDRIQNMIANTPEAPQTHSGELTTITLNELNSGHFTVDLGGITIPAGGTINFDELVSNGRLIFIQTAATDPEANKENEEQQQLHQNNMLSTTADNILAELGGSVGGGGQHQQIMTVSEDSHNRGGFSSSYYTDSSLSLDLGGGEYGGKGADSNNLHGILAFGETPHHDGFPPTSSCSSTSATQEMTMVPPSEVIAPITSSESHHHQDLEILDQVLHPLSSAYQQLPTSTVTPTIASAVDHAHHLHHHLPSLNEAALYESKELGISYTFQTEVPSSSGILNDHPHHHHSDLLQ